MQTHNPISPVCVTFNRDKLSKLYIENGVECHSAIVLPLISTYVLVSSDHQEKLNSICLELIKNPIHNYCDQPKTEILAP